MSSPPQWRIGNDFDLAARPNELSSVRGAGTSIVYIVGNRVVHKGIRQLDHPQW